MKKSRYTLIAALVASTLLTSISTLLTSCGGFEALGYYKNGEIQMTPKRLAGNEQYVADITAYYQQVIGDNGTITYADVTTDTTEYDVYTITFRSTQTTGDDAYNAIKALSSNQSEWMDKLPGGNWYTTFQLSYGKYGGSSETVNWAKEQNMLAGTWVGTLPDNSDISFNIGTACTDSTTHKWRNTCTMTYNNVSLEGYLYYSCSMNLVNGCSTDSVQGVLTLGSDTCAIIKLNINDSGEKCAATTLILDGVDIINVTDIENGIALRREE